MIDRTEETAGIHQTLNRRNIFSRGNPNARRSVGSLTGVILHHTNFTDPRLRRFDYIIANFAVLTDGRVLKLREPSVVLNSVGSDHRAVDIEFEGRYHTTDLPAPPAVQLRAGRNLVAQLRHELGLTRIYAHAHFTAKPCPGPSIWYNVGEWAVGNGMSTAGSLRSLPAGWTDPSLEIRI